MPGPLSCPLLPPHTLSPRRAPLTLSRNEAHEALFRPHVLVRGLAAHLMAEALLNAPQMLGSLQLLFNPTGLVESLRAGMGDLIGLPLAALEARSAALFLAGLGQGSASLVRHISGAWLLLGAAQVQSAGAGGAGAKGDQCSLQC